MTTTLFHPARGLRAATLAAVIGLASTAASAALLTLDAGGRLLGATGVIVGGAHYDVEFRDGSCVTLFNGCDSLSDFAFNTLDSAFEAASALHEQVFSAASARSIDLDPSLTRGCEGAWGTNAFGERVAGCWVLTPTIFSIDGQLATTSVLNDNRDAYDLASRTLLIFGQGFDTGAGGQWARRTYAVWSAGGAVSAVPTPASAALVLAALAMLAVTTAGSRPAR